MIRKLVLLSAVAALTFTGCASNPATGGHNVVLGTKQGEIENSRRLYEQIIRTYGLYEDQAVQDYVNSVGQKVAKNSDLPDGRRDLAQQWGGDSEKGERDAQRKSSNDWHLGASKRIVAAFRARQWCRKF